MKGNRAYAKLSVSVLLAVVLLVSCLGEGSRTTAIEGAFTIIWDAGGGLSSEQHVVHHLKAKFPETSYQLTPFIRSHRLSGAASKSVDVYMIAENDLPGDLIVFESTMAPYLFESGYLEPLDGLFNHDVSMLDEADGRAIEVAMKQGKGTLFGIPFGKNVYALYYNKSMLDELGLPHPTDGMTWDEVFELSGMMADHPQMGDRLALDIYSFPVAFSQIHFRYLNEHGSPAVDSPLWERGSQFFEQWRAQLERTGAVSYEMFGFADGRTAMLAAHYLGDDTTGGYTNRPFASPRKDEWDLVSYPVFADQPDTGPYPAYYYVGIPKNSRKKQEAFQLITHLLTHEVQLENSRMGLAGILDDPVMVNQFGQQDQQLGGKNTAAFFHHREQGSLDVDFDWEMERVGAGIFAVDVALLQDVIDFRIEKLEKVGTVLEDQDGE